MAPGDRDEFERLVAEARSQKFSGWDFSWLKNRLVEESPPWDYEQEITREISRVKSLLDLGTGGGELLSSLAQLPKRTYVTEGYPPNAAIARDRLRQLGVDVVRTYADYNTAEPQAGALPFCDESLDMVIDRHESFVAGEVCRVLKRGGIFLTQQVGSDNYPELNEFLGAPKNEKTWDLQVARQQISEAGLSVAEGREAQLHSRFRDVGAVVFLLLAVPWQLEGFTVDGYMDKLKELHRSIIRAGSFKVTCRRFYVRALKR
ncbi:MAG: class I SAM-dependent methyltransferase [Nitrososphaerales archaeon]